MAKVAWLIINNKFHRLVSDDGGKYWFLYWRFAQEELQDAQQHLLDYWRTKGIVESEIDKGKGVRHGNDYSKDKRRGR